MKNILYLLILITVVVSCSKDDDISLSVSQNELAFTVEGGEQVVNITSDGTWECQYSDDWLLVRQQQNRIRVIVDANPTDSERTANIQVICDGETRNQIVVTQAGLTLNVEISNVDAKYAGEEISIPIECNSDWKIENSCEWIETQNNGAILKLIVARNYQMQERQGNITLKSGDLSKSIMVEQAGAPWYESFEMVTVDAGSFYMGAQKESVDGINYDASAYMIEAPVHKTSVNAFSIGRFEITQAQWIAAMGENPSTIQGDNLPVENVTWEQVQEFINILNDKSGKNYRLPTEAEWEFAAKGGNKTEGFIYSGYSVLGACGWYYSNSDATIHEIGSKYANELGLFDMSGNVREWCNDWYEAYSTDDADNPQGPTSGSMKINRGGSWTTPAVNCRNTYRHTDFPNEAAQDLGFRLALPE